MRRSRASAPLRVAIALLAGALVLAVGLGYAATRERAWEADATLALVPDPRDEQERTILLEAFDSSGTIGTFVELIDSRDILREAGVTSSEIDVRTVPDTRVIEVTATGERERVADELAAVIATAREHQADLGSLWKLEPLDTPDEPVEAGPSDPALLIATGVLALLAAIAGAVLAGTLVRLLGGPPARPEAPAQPPAPPAPAPAPERAPRPVVPLER